MKKIITNKFSVLIVGIVRNVASTLFSDIGIIDRAFGDFHKVAWLIIESDSNDDTLKTLNILKKKYELEFHSLGKLSDRFPKRTERIAFCRNEYVKIINSNVKYANVDYIAVVDLDGVNSYLNEISINNAFQICNLWDACFANQLAPYYDIWALRHISWSPDDCWQKYKLLINNKLGRYKARKEALYSRMKIININEKPIEVDSAFGGLGIYKKQLFENIKYIGVSENGDEVCEHVSIHYQMRRRGAKLYILPNLTNGGWNNHSIQLKFFGILKIYILETILECLILVLPKKYLLKLKRYLFYI